MTKWPTGGTVRQHHSGGQVVEPGFRHAVKGPLLLVGGERKNGAVQPRELRGERPMYGVAHAPAAPWGARVPGVPRHRQQTPRGRGSGRYGVV